MIIQDAMSLWVQSFLNPIPRINVTSLQCTCLAQFLVARGLKMTYCTIGKVLIFYDEKLILESAF